MSFSVSVCYAGMTQQQKEEADDMLTQISLMHQDAMAAWFEEQKERKLREKQKKMKMAKEEEQRSQSEQLQEKWKQEEFERERQIREREKSINWSKRHR